LLATGPKKADCLAAAFEGPFSPDNPASLLQDHADITFIVDKDAASKIKNK
jgi:glucosamine-6-phosphate deaminase